MSQTQHTGGLDWFRLPAALLVAAIHTGPLLSVSATANYLITDILARVAVPFFFTVSGLFLLPRVQKFGFQPLLPFWRKCALLYAVSTLLYLPLKLYGGGWAGVLPFLRALVFDGTFYHLWYFPAAMLGAYIAAALFLKGPRLSLAVCGLLYLLGLLGDSFYGLIAATPISRLYGFLFHLFEQTRNGIFFAPLFLLLGGLMAGRPAERPVRRQYAVGLGLSLAALLAEGLAVRHFALARFDAMYASLPFCLWFLTGWLRTLPLSGRPTLRTAAAVFYIVHPLCIVGVRSAAKVLHCTDLLVQCSPVHYLAVCAVSAAISLPFALWRRGRRKPEPPTKDGNSGGNPPGGDRKGRAWIELDTGALRHNISALQALLSPKESLMAVVKANAYGHGDLEIARLCASSGVDAFAVATPEEGAHLRAGGISGEILVLGWTGPESAPLLARFRLTQTVVSLEHAHALNQAGIPLSVHLKLDTGMHRLGIPWDDRAALTRIAASCSNLRITGAYTHLAAAGNCSAHNTAATQEQVRRFSQGVAALRAAGCHPEALHVQSSYGLLNYGDLPCAWARVGIALYGVLSRPGDCTRAQPDLRPVLSLRARVAQVRTLAAGEQAGYDGAFTPSGPARVAVITIGYADGLPRALSNGRGGVLLHGQYAPIAGLICMDQLLADVTHVDGVVPGDTATLIGRDGKAVITAGHLAEACGTITNELLSRLGPRLDRITVPETDTDLSAHTAVYSGGLIAEFP